MHLSQEMEMDEKSILLSHDNYCSEQFNPHHLSGSKLAHRNFGLGSLTIMILEEGSTPPPQTTTRGRKPSSVIRLIGLDAKIGR